MKKLSKSNKPFFLLVILSLMIWTACKVDKITPVGSEPVKDITGSWKVIKATRNGADILAALDTNIYSFSKFRVNFSGSGYTLTNALPFIVDGNGKFALDNPQFPFKITFTATGSTTPVSTAFTYPIINGVRQLVLVFSPGCPQNIYSYTLQKVN
jgi:hypothetical protein